MLSLLPAVAAGVGQETLGNVAPVLLLTVGVLMQASSMGDEDAVSGLIGGSVAVLARSLAEEVHKKLNKPPAKPQAVESDADALIG